MAVGHTAAAALLKQSCCKPQSMLLTAVNTVVCCCLQGGCSSNANNGGDLVSDTRKSTLWQDIWACWCMLLPLCDCFSSVVLCCWRKAEMVTWIRPTSRLYRRCCCCAVSADHCFCLQLLRSSHSTPAWHGTPAPALQAQTPSPTSCKEIQGA